MKKIALFGLLAMLSQAVLAQVGTVRGNVFDEVTGAAVSFATVRVEGTKFGASSDEEGFFTISNIPVGSYKLSATFVGYETKSVDIEVKKGQILYQKIFLAENKVDLKEVEISAKREQARTQVQVSKITVTPKQIRALPSTGGQADIAQYLTVLPGVIFTGDQGGQLYIRGGSPVQNRILLDGMTIYNPFHSIGFFSVFETELIRTVDVFTGGFNAEYGGRVSAILDMKTREGNRKRLGGTFSGSPFQAKAVIEGPIVKLKGEDGSSVSFIVTGKKSLIDRTGKDLYKQVNDGNGIPFEHQDLYSKVSVMAANGSRLNLFGFNFQDDVKYAVAQYGWKSTGGGGNFTLVPQNSNTIVDGVIAFSKYDSELKEGDGEPRQSGVSGFNANLNFTSFGRGNELKYGVEINGYTTDFQFVNFKKLTINQKSNTSELDGYVKYRQKAGPIVVEPSIRLQYYSSFNKFSPEPRLGLKCNLTDRLRLKAAGGIYTQNLISTVNEKDIVNLFVGYLSEPDGTLYKPNSTEEAPDKLQHSVHGVGGVEIDLTKNIDLNVETYYKGFTQLIALNRNKTAADQPDFTTEKGEAHGIDFNVKMELQRAYFWATYSLGFVNRNDGEQKYPPVFDRRHNCNLLATYQAGKKKEWEFGVRWNLGSGFPFTLTQGFFNQIDFSNGIQTDVLGGNTADPSQLGILYSKERNGGRLPYYHRLDVSVKRTFEFTKYSKLELTASATNAYDRENIFYFDRVSYARVNQLPVLPSLAATFSF